MKKLLVAIKNNTYRWYKKERKMLCLSLLCGVVATAFAAVYTKNYSDKIVSGIASQIIRFHVLANSDEAHDQSLKLIVKDKVLEEYSGIINTSSSIEETRRMLEANLGGIETLAQNIVYDEGYDYGVKASLAKDKFPTKQYGDITLPAGDYEALRIEIGNSGGQNWWCVMFPPLCYVDITKNEIDEGAKETLRSILSEEEYMLMDNNIRQTDDIIKIKFKIVEWWQEKNAFIDADDIVIAQNIIMEIAEGSF